MSKKKEKKEVFQVLFAMNVLSTEQKNEQMDDGR